MTCANVGGDASAWLDAIDAAAVQEIHLAGHAVNDADGRTVLIDDHGSCVADPVWELYEHAIARFGATPALDVLLTESAKAERRLAKVSDVVAA